MTRRSLLTLLFLGILSASCGPSAAGQPTPDINATIQANAQTMAAALFQTQTALAPAATNTALPTATFLPTSTALTTLLSPTTFVQQPVYVAATATPTGTYYTATPLNSSLAVGCKNLALVEGWTEPDGPFVAGQRFVQYWQVANTGTCDWLYGFEVVFVSGEKMGGGGSIGLSKKFEPKKWTTFSVVLHAPNNSGTYKASWQMSDGAGTKFGSILPVSITVGGSTKTPKPPTATPNLQQTADAANTAVAAQQQTAAAKTAIAQQTENAAAQQTADACALTQTAGGTCP